MRIKVVWPIAMLAIGFGLMETAHFGWHIRPVNDAEMICDGICLIIAALSFRAEDS